MRGHGPCSECGEPIEAGAAFINIGATNGHDPEKPRTARWIPVDEDIHGWSPFVKMHPACYAQADTIEALLRLVDESHRSMRRRLQR